MGIVVVADRRFHRDRFLGDFHDLADLVLWHFHLDRQGGRIGFRARFLQDLAGDPVHLVDRLDHVHGNADRARLVGDRARDGLADPPGRIGRELVAAAILELVDRLHQANIAFLDQIEELQAAVRVFLGDRNDQAQVGLRHFALGLACLHFTGRHLAVDVAQVRQRQYNPRLQVDQALLQFLDGRNVAAQDGAVRVSCVDFAIDPVEVGFIAGEDLDEVGARHAAAVHGHVEDLLLDMAHFIDLAAQGVAQLFHHLGREADAQQLLRNGVLRLGVGLGVVAFFLESAAHLVELLRNDGKFFQRRTFQRFQLLGREAGSAGSVRLFLFFDFLFFRFAFFLVFFDGSGHDRRGGDRFAFIDEAVDDFVDLDLFVGDAVGGGDDFGDRHGTGGNGLDHVFQAIFDALGNLDLAFARQQLDRAHFAHVHAHGVGGAAKVGIDGRQCSLGRRFRLVIAGDNGNVIGQQQRFRIGRVFVDGDAHVIEGTDDAFDGFRIDDVFGQVIVDFRVGQETAFLAELDQCLEFLAPALEFFLARFRVGRERVLQQRALFRLAVLGLGLVDGLQFGPLDGVQGGDFIIFWLEFFWLAAAAAWYFYRRQDIPGRIDGRQSGGVGGLADHGRAGHARFWPVERLFGFRGNFSGLYSRFGFGFLDWHRRFRLHNDLLYGGLG